MIVSNMSTLSPNVSKEKKPLLKLGTCIQHVKIDNILKLLELAHNKIDFEFEEAILKGIMEKDEAFLRRIQEGDLDDGKGYDEHHIIDMVRMSYIQIVEIMVKLDARLDLKAMNDVYYGKDEHG